MDTIVLQAMAKWPHVPAVFDWLSLDRRGRYRLDSRPIYHHNMLAFIARNYAADENGRWFFQNGPQRVYVTLSYTPWIVQLSAKGHLETHAGQPIAPLKRRFIDEDGNLLLQFADSQIGLADDRDLLHLSSALVTASGCIADTDDLAGFIAEAPGYRLYGRKHPSQSVASTAAKSLRVSALSPIRNPIY